MKTNVKCSQPGLCFLLLLVLFSGSIMAQPDYIFKNAVLKSGTNLQKNAKYLFSNVKPGVDAFVTLTDISPGVTLVELDGASGYTETLQPTLKIDPWTNGYVEMTINFVHAGTSNSFVQPQVAVTCIDVDGVINHDGQGHDLHEFDEINLGGGYTDFDLVGGEVSVAQNGNWFTGTNMAGIDYPGRDTAAKAVMFTIFNVNVATAIIRVGVNNQTAVIGSRLRSVYFKRFIYPNSALLASSALIDFRGSGNDSKVLLQWKLADESPVAKVVVEKRDGSMKFQPIGEVVPHSKGAPTSGYRFNDNVSASGEFFYRLKLIGLNGSIEYSDVISVRLGDLVAKAFRIFPTNVISSANISVESKEKGKAVLQLIDYSGRILMNQNINVNNGANNIAMNNLASMSKGNYVAVLRMNNEVYQQKIVKM
ncbi:MAG: T9SS type A sorting domain-containing protein [Chitinophagaceae bacterium]